MSDPRNIGATEYDWMELQRRAYLEFERRLAAVVDWSGPTPDDEWNTAQLVRHVIEEQQWVPFLLDGRTLREAQLAKRPLGEDLAAEWRHYSTVASEAWAEAELTREIRLSSDTVSADHYLRELVADIAIHTWDLARAVGSDESLDPLLVEAVWTVFEPQKDALVASGLYAAPVPLSEDAPLQSRLLALTGRDDGVRG